MPRILRTERAEVNLIDILTFLRSRAPLLADRFESDLEEKTRLLAQFPLMGRDRSDLAPRLRGSLIKPYMILYRPLDDGIEIIPDHPRVSRRIQPLRMTMRRIAKHATFLLLITTPAPGNDAPGLIRSA
jgi:toxin ParE1/3/4